MKLHSPAFDTRGNTALAHSSGDDALSCSLKNCASEMKLPMETSAISRNIVVPTPTNGMCTGLEKNLTSPKALHDLSIAGTSASTDRIKPEAEAFYKRGKKFFGEGNIHSAIPLITMAIVIDPFNDLYYTARAECLESVGLYTAALKDFIASNILHAYNLRAWRGIIFNTYRLSRVDTAKAMLAKLKSLQNGLKDTTGFALRELENCIRECQELIYKRTHYPCATYIGDINLDVWHYMTDGLHRWKQQELIMIDAPIKKKGLPKGWHSYGWAQLLQLKKINTDFRKHFSTGDILQWQHNTSSTSYCALFFSVENEHQIEIIKHDLYREGYESNRPAKTYAFVKLFSNKEEAHKFYVKHSKTYVANIVENAHEWRQRYSRGELIAPPQDDKGSILRRISTKKGKKVRKTKIFSNKPRSWLRLSW